MICAVVLAAGRSERMGTQKLLLPLGGKPVIARVVDELLRSPVEQIFTVVGRDGEELRAALSNRPVHFVGNPDPTSEMLGSVRCGLRALPSGGEAVLVVLGDQPGISHELVSDMICCFRGGNSSIVVPTCEGHRGHPILFSIRFCDEVLNGYAGKGLRGLLDAHPEEICGLEVAAWRGLEDMDTPTDYERLEKFFATSVRPSPARRRNRSS
jgi:molybdenum cofactor cytidylyltransferase